MFDKSYIFQYSFEIVLKNVFQRLGLKVQFGYRNACFWISCAHGDKHWRFSFFSKIVAVRVPPSPSTEEHQSSPFLAGGTLVPSTEYYPCFFLRSYLSGCVKVNLATCVCGRAGRCRSMPSGGWVGRWGVCWMCVCVCA